MWAKLNDSLLYTKVRKPLYDSGAWVTKVLYLLAGSSGDQWPCHGDTPAPMEGPVVRSQVSYPEGQLPPAPIQSSDD